MAKPEATKPTPAPTRKDVTVKVTLPPIIGGTS